MSFLVEVITLCLYICNMAPNPRIFYVRGRRPRTKNPRLRGHIVVYCLKKPNIYNIYSTFSGSQNRRPRVIYYILPSRAIYIYCPASRAIYTVIPLLSGIYTIWDTDNIGTIWTINYFLYIAPKVEYIYINIPLTYPIYRIFIFDQNTTTIWLL